MPQFPDDGEAYFLPAIQVCHRAFYAIYTGDLAALEKEALPDPDLATVLSKEFVPKYDLPALKQSIEEMQINPAGSEPPRIGDEVLELGAYFRGTIMPVTLVRRGDEWKMDCRWWIAARRPDDEPRTVARAFLYAWMTGDLATLAKTAVPHSRLGDLLRNGSPPAGEFAQLHHICEATIFIPAVLGEQFLATTSEMETVISEHVGDDRLLLLARIGSQPPAMPLQLAKIGGAWRVDAAKLIEMMASA
jgi:hypothetical protein